MADGKVLSCRFNFVVRPLLFAIGKQARWLGGRQELIRSAFKGRTVRDAFCLRQNATIVGVFGVAGCFADGVRRTVVVATFSVQGLYRPRRILPSAKCYGGWCVWCGGVFCLRQNATRCRLSGVAVCFADGVRRTEADGGCSHVQCLGGRTVRDAFCLRQNATVVGLSGVAGCFAVAVCGGRRRTVVVATFRV